MTRTHPTNVERLLADKERATHERQAIVLRGQDLLSRAHALGKTIEAHVRQALGETVPPSRMGFPATPLLRRGNESPR